MKDLVIKQTGNSRTLKTSLSSGTTWEQALAMLIAGTFPVDILGIQSAGVQTQGTALNKVNMLSDDTATAAGFTSDEDPTVNDALYRLLSLIASKVTSTDLDDVELEVGETAAVGWTTINFKKGFTDTPWVLAVNPAAEGVAVLSGTVAGSTGTAVTVNVLQETANVTGLSMQVYGPAKYIAIYDGGAK